MGLFGNNMFGEVTIKSEVLNWFTINLGCWPIKMEVKPSTYGNVFSSLMATTINSAKKEISKHECFSLSQDAESPINWWACMKIKKPLGNPCGNPMAGDPPTWRASMRRVHHSGSVQHEHGCRCQEHQSCPEQLNHSSWSNQKKHQSKRFDLKAKKKLHHTGPYYIFTLKIIPNLQKKTDHQPEPPTRTPTRALRCWSLSRQCSREVATTSSAERPALQSQPLGLR